MSYMVRPQQNTIQRVPTSHDSLYIHHIPKYLNLVCIPVQCKASNIGAQRTDLSSQDRACAPCNTPCDATLLAVTSELSQPSPDPSRGHLRDASVTGPAGTARRPSRPLRRERISGGGERLAVELRERVEDPLP